MKPHVTEIETSAGIWKVAVKGDELMIIDQAGRCRHRSTSHAVTGCFLACQLAKKPMGIDDLHKVFKEQADAFLESDS